MKVLVIIPTFNEAENIGPLIESLLSLDIGLHVLAVDDNSPDGTGAIVTELASSHPQVHLKQRPQKMGLGTAYTAGFEFALERGYDRVLTMDADFSHNPRYVPLLVELSERFDLSIGSRYVSGGGVRLWSLPRRALSRGANRLARTTLGLQTSDCTAGFRCYRAEVLRAIDPASINTDGYSYLLETLWRVKTCGFTVAETPIFFTDRRRGTSKISSTEVLRAGSTIVRLAFTPHHKAPVAQPTVVSNENSPI